MVYIVLYIIISMYMCKRCNWRGNEAQHGYCPNCYAVCVYSPSGFEDEPVAEHKDKTQSFLAEYDNEIKVSFKEWKDKLTKERFAIIQRRLNWRKEFGENTLNTPFIGCEGHHIDKGHIIYIPVVLHRSVYHNLRTGQGMNEINKLAREFLENDMRVI